MNRLTPILMVALASVVMFAGVAAAQPGSALLFGCSTAEGIGHGIFKLAQSSGPIDLQACQQDCRINYGLEPFFRGGDGSSRWWIYTSCIQDCNRRFWKEYDRQMRDLQEGTD